MVELGSHHERLLRFSSSSDSSPAIFIHTPARADGETQSLRKATRESNGKSKPTRIDRFSVTASRSTSQRRRYAL